MNASEICTKFPKCKFILFLLYSIGVSQKHGIEEGFEIMEGLVDGIWEITIITITSIVASKDIMGRTGIYCSVLGKLMAMTL